MYRLNHFHWTVMESIGERLKKVRLAVSMEQTAFAEALGLASRDTISRWERNLNSPSADSLLLLNEKFGINVEWLLFETGPMLVSEKVSQIKEATYQCLDTEQYELVPLLSSWVAGGPQGEILYEGVADHYPFKRWWVEHLVGRSSDRRKALLMVKVRGDSMIPTISPGEVILVDTFEGERVEVRTGKIYIVKLPDGSVAVKRLALNERASGLRLICMSDNPNQAHFDFDLDPGRRLQDYVLGRVRWAGKEFD